MRYTYVNVSAAMGRHVEIIILSLGKYGTVPLMEQSLKYPSLDTASTVDVAGKIFRRSAGTQRSIGRFASPSHACSQHDVSSLIFITPY